MLCDTERPVVLAAPADEHVRREVVRAPMTASTGPVQLRMTAAAAIDVLPAKRQRRRFWGLSRRVQAAQPAAPMTAAVPAPSTLPVAQTAHHDGARPARSELAASALSELRGLYEPSAAPLAVALTA